MSTERCLWPAELSAPATLLKWHVSVGADVDLGDALLSAQTPAGPMTWPTPVAGRISALLVQAGDRLAAGKPVFEFSAVPAPTALPRHRHTEARLQQALARRQRHHRSRTE